MRFSSKFPGKYGVVLICGMALWLGGRSEAQERVPEARGTGLVVPRNPYTDPVLNPFLNPYMALRPMDSQQWLYHFMAAQRAREGIGSGVPSGTRAPGESQGDRPAYVPRTAMRPGSGAAHYFGRGASAPPSRVVAGRHNRYFNHNGR